MPPKFQVNISPPEEVLDLLDQTVERFGARHMVCKNRNQLVNEILQRFLIVQIKLLERYDGMINEEIEQILKRGGPIPS